MSRRIFLSGVHGVGKGYFITHKLANIPGLSVVSASEIIRQYHDPEDARNKRVKDVTGNQELLLGALKNYMGEHKETIVLDGHLVLLDSQDCIKRIPFSFFEAGMFDTVIVLQDNPNLIYKRMYARDGVHKIEINLIEQIQEKEIEYAKELGYRGIEVCFITPSSDEACYIKYFREEGIDGIC